ncbi:MAG TPA: YncE family protein, partial [Verrucomicrobiae bacterium]
MKPLKTLTIIALSFQAMLGLVVRGADVPASPGYHLLKEIPIGGEGGWDYLTIDEKARRLYVTHDTNIVVVDIDAEKITGQIGNTPGVHGFAVVPDYSVGFSSNGKEGRLSLVNLKTLKTRSKVKAGRNPDAILYDPGSQQVYAFNGGDNSVTIVEGDDGDDVATTKLPGKPEFAVVEPKAGRVYCNLADKSTVAVIDTVSHQVVSLWPIAPGENASGMAFDAVHHRLFLGCDGNNLMVMMDSTDGKVVASVPIGAGVDAN